MKTLNIKKTIQLLIIILICKNVSAIINPPSLSSPSNNLTIKNFQTYLQVTAVTGVVKYEFQLDTTISFNSFRLKTLSSSNRFVVTPVLLMNKNYYWRARIFSATDSSNWTNYRMVAIHYKMDLASPTSTSTGSIRPMNAAQWHLDSAVKYLFQFDTVSSFNSSQFIQRSSFSQAFLDTAYFKFGRKIFWRATAIDAEGDTLQWSNSNSYTFFTSPTTNSSTADGARVIIGWGNCLSASVVLQLDVSSGFNTSNLIEKTLKPGTILDTNYNLLFGKTYYYRIKAVLGPHTSNWSTARLFSTISAFNSTSPLNKATSILLTPQLNWNNINFVSFELQLAKDTFFNDLIGDTILNTNSCLFDDTLNFSTRYFWRVRAFHPKDTSNWQNFYFNTYLGQVPQTIPTDGRTDLGINVSLQFYHYPWVDAYYMEIDTGKVFQTSPSSFRITKTQFTNINANNKSFDTTLKFNSTYCWRVFAIKDGDTSGFAVTRYFTTQKRPVLNFPNNNYVGIGTSTNALIQPMNGSHQVLWQLDTSSKFNSPLLINGKDSHFLDDFFTTQVQLNFPKDLRFETQYFWRAKCVFINDSSLWSLPFNFITTQRPWITSPTHLSTNVPLATTLKWGVQGSASDYIYQYQWSTDSNFIGTPIISLPKESSAEASVINNYGTTYFWRGRALHSKDTSLWSLRAQYRSIPPPNINKIQLATPPNNSIKVPLPDVDLIWYGLSNVSSYDIEISIDANFNTILISGNALGNGVTFRGMNSGATYYWRVRGKINNYNGPWSDVWKFTTAWGVGVEENEWSLQLKLFPNPCIDVLNIQYPSIFDVTIHDINGQKIFEQEQVQESLKINTMNFPIGIYLISIKTSEGIIKRKIVVGH
ncbi:MAG: T9SS type A sorting domain-containing protein [Bacteroidota bacterium]|nr:T9SS type A sorting domain-containing protein [Bacteroidota bacterium]